MYSRRYSRVGLRVTRKQSCCAVRRAVDLLEKAKISKVTTRTQPLMYRSLVTLSKEQCKRAIAPSHGRDVACLWHNVYRVDAQNTSIILAPRLQQLLCEVFN